MSPSLSTSGKMILVALDLFRCNSLYTFWYTDSLYEPSSLVGPVRVGKF
jgi:hypothetical protein